MKNADKPIYPVIEKTDFEIDGKRFSTIGLLGLSKREHFAGLTLQGLLAANNGQSNLYLVKTAIKTADALLNELEKPQENGTSN